MGLLSWIFKRKYPNHNHDFGDEDRQLSMDLRLQKAELKRLKSQLEIEREKLRVEEAKAELEDLRDTLYPPEEEEEEGSVNTPETMILSLLMNAFKTNNVRTTTTTPTGTTPSTLSLTDEQIKGYMEALPKDIREEMRKLSDQELKAIVKERVGNLTEDTLNRIVVLAKQS